MSSIEFGPATTVGDVLAHVRLTLPADRRLDSLTGRQWAELSTQLMRVWAAVLDREREVRTMPVGNAQLQLVADDGRVLVPVSKLRRTPLYRQPRQASG